MKAARYPFPILASLVLFAALAPATHAQMFSLQGEVTLDDGKPAAGAKVLVTPAAGAGNKAHRQVKVKKNGTYKIPMVEFGTYTFSAEMEGYLIGRIDIVIKTGQNLTEMDQGADIGPMQEIPPFDIDPGRKVTVNIKLVPKSHFAAALSIPGDKDATRWLGEANTLTGEGRYEESDELLRKILETGNATGNVYYILGRNAYSTNRKDEAMEHFAKAIELNPDQSGVFAQMASIAHEQGDPERAAELFAKELEVTPDAVPVAINRAVVLTDLGKTEEAVAAWEKVLELSPTEAGAYAELASLFTGLGQEDRAVELLEQMEEVTQPDPAQWFNIGANFSNRENYEKAEMAYRKALELDPTFPQPLRELGYLLVRKGDQQAALEQFDEYLEVAPDAPDADQVRAIRDALAKAIGGS